MAEPRRSIRFYLGDALRELSDVDPSMTVLEYLRTVERRCGTKEGCAEGDCGACTVAVGRPSGDGVRYLAVNACIQFVATLDGCHVLTVEDLTGPDGRLHPVQQAMVEHHASQCGFCTPGFVMSLFALYEETEDGPPSRDRIDDALAGNLCRCTGYGAIVAAGRAMVTGTPHPRASRDERMRQKLGAIAPVDDVALGREGRLYWAPASPESLGAVLADAPDTTVVAGATDVGLWVTKAQRTLERMVFLGNVAGLDRIAETDGWIEIGATATYRDAMPVLGRHYPPLGELMRRIGGEQVRNLGTIGGNIANGSPIGDSMPPLIALGARLVVSSRGDGEREMPLEDFFLEYGRQDLRPGEFVARVRVPAPTPGHTFFTYKISKRFDQDITAVCAALGLEIDAGRIASARVAFGGMAATPCRATACEAALSGEVWSADTVERAARALDEDFAPITDWRASAGYRARVAGNLLRRAYLETTAAAPVSVPLRAGPLARLGAAGAIHP